VSFDDARTIMDYLATHGWRPSSDLLTRYGAR
jgi:hypothetical protein